MNKHATKITPLQVFSALLITCMLLSGAVVLTLHFRPLYYFDIHHLSLPERTGLSAADIRQNYDALIDYNSFFGPKTLSFPTLPMSETGRIHFEEVKAIFLAVEAIALGAFLASAGCTLLLLRKGRIVFLKLAAIFSVGLPALLGGLVALNWSQFFTVFHKIFFRNDYWIFSAETDPVITILPDTFFLHCALLILGLVVLGSLLCFGAYRFFRRRRAT